MEDRAWPPAIVVLLDIFSVRRNEVNGDHNTNAEECDQQANEGGRRLDIVGRGRRCAGLGRWCAKRHLRDDQQACCQYQQDVKISR